MQLDERAPESMRISFGKLYTEIIRLRNAAESADTELRDEIREMRQYTEKLAQENGRERRIAQECSTALSKAANEQVAVLTGLEKTSAMVVEQVRANQDSLQKLYVKVEKLGPMESPLQVLTDDSRPTVG